MGLLDVFNTPEGMQGLALLGAAGPSMEPQNLASRFAQAGASYRGMQQGLLKDDYIRSQIAENASQAAERKALTDAKAAELARQQRIQQGIPSLYGGGYSGGAAVPQTLGGEPMFSQPMGVTPMQANPGAFNWQRAIAMGMKPEEAEKYAKLPELGRQEVARTVEGRDKDGRPVTFQYDKFGQLVGGGVEQWKAPVFEGLGNRKAAIDPVTMKEIGSFNIGQSPDSAASNAVTMRGQNMTDARAKETNALGRVPTGYRQTADGSLEFVPGGPADPAVAKRAAPTEFQGKSTTFGARMQDASKVIGELEGKVWPSTVARAGYRAEFPSWLPGGQLMGGAATAANRWAVPEDAQRYYQAQENWVTANLRQESGAAIGKDEMTKDITKWFPQPGDSDAVKAQKASARAVAERALTVQAGPGAASIPSIMGDAPMAPVGASSAGGAVQWRYVNGKLVKAQ